MGVLPWTPARAAAQLRPLDPLEWRTLGDGTAHAGLGLGMLRDQRASLAGARGTLLELGNWLITFRSGRLALEFTGTAVRRFTDDALYAEPADAADASIRDVRVDAGDVRVGTVLRLAGDVDRHVVAIRFGTRLPTPSDEQGLDRDRTDFYATMAGRLRLARGLQLVGETGVGIHSTIIDSYPQSDVLIYAAALEQRWPRAGMRIGIVGHDDLHRRVIRGNEDLAEVRLTGWYGDTRRIEATFVRGIAEFSPSWGLLIRASAQLW